MGEKIETNKICEILADDDVVMLASNHANNTSGTFTVKQLKQLLSNKISQEIISTYSGRNTSSSYIKSELSTISIGSDSFVCRELNLTWIQGNCKHLKVSYGGWQEGELRVHINIGNSYSKGDKDKRQYAAIDNIFVEFCLDRSPEPTPSLESASPLDEIRQSEEYKKVGQ